LNNIWKDVTIAKSTVCVDVWKVLLIDFTPISYYRGGEECWWKQRQKRNGLLSEHASF